jgi:hypothetical protein
MSDRKRPAVALATIEPKPSIVAWITRIGCVWKVIPDAL